MKKRDVAAALAVFFTASTCVALMSCSNYMSKAKSAPSKIQEHNGAIGYVTDYIGGDLGGDLGGGYEWQGSDSNYEYAQQGPEMNTEEYNAINENSFIKVSDSPLSTFAADVDTGSYCNLRRILNNGGGTYNVANAIRTEEMINYFDYEVESEDDVFSVQYSVGECPWNEENKLLVMTLQANSQMNVPSEGSNFVYLIDTSGSMYDDGYELADRLTLVKKSFGLLTGRMGPNDRVSIVTYAGDSQVVLSGSNDPNEILRALDSLTANGGTNGSGGIEAAYRCAEQYFIPNGNNRVIIASDGDMNLGITSQSGLVDLIKREKESGVFLTVLGYGAGNYSDANMESIADAGNGNYFYIDSIDEAERVLCSKLKQTTVTVAKDVKFQLEFNPAEVYEYRQIGYENRWMSASDFSDDTKDGGEIGAGAQVTVCYEIVPVSDGKTSEESLKYQDSTLSENAGSGELCTVSVRYKEPTAAESHLIEYPIMDNGIQNTADFDFICGVIEASLVLRNSEYKGTATYDTAYQLAKAGAGDDHLRNQFCDLVIKLKVSDENN